MRCGLTCAKVTICILNLLAIIATYPVVLFFVNYMSAFCSTLVLYSVYFSLIGLVFGCINSCSARAEPTCGHAAIISFAVIARIVGMLFCTIRGRVESLMDLVWEDAEKMSDLEKPGLCCGKDGPSDYTRIGREIPSNCYSFAHQLNQIGCTDRYEEALAYAYAETAASRWISFALLILVVAGAAYIIRKFEKEDTNADVNNLLASV